MFIFLVLIYFLVLPGIIHAQIPSKSTYISTINWNQSTLFTAAPGSDLWPSTWSSDDALYLGWGDGGGFGGTNDTGRVQWGIAKITGGPTGLVENCNTSNKNLININGGNCTLNSSSNIASYINSIISINGRLYAWLNMEPGDPDHVYRLAWSDDKGKTWTKSSWSFNLDFSPKSFIQFGKDYTGALDNYVYMYGNPYDDPAAGYSLKDVYLIRAPISQLTDKNSYTYFSGLDFSNKPTWSSQVTSKKSIFTWDKGIGIPQVVYNAGLHRYILSGAVKAGELGIFEAQNPWGPWYTVQTYNNWIGLEDNKIDTTSMGLIYGFVNKWTSTNGLNTTMIFSCYGCNAANHDRFNLIQGTFVLTSTAPTNTPILSSIPSHTPQPTITIKPGDANADGKVNGIDYVIWLTNYGKPSINGYSSGDFNRDEVVNGIDYVIWLNHYGS